MGAPSIWVVGDTTSDGALARASAEVATLARGLADAAATELTGVVVSADPERAARELAGYLPNVVACVDPQLEAGVVAGSVGLRVAELVAARGGAWILTSGGTDGRDIAGTLSVRLGWGVLANASRVTSANGVPEVEATAFGGRLVVTSSFLAGRGIITVRPGAVQAVASEVGQVELVDASVTPTGSLSAPLVRVVERVEGSTAAASLDDARIVVTAGRGVSGEQGMALVRDLAAALGGAAVGATRAAVDSGWLPYALQIGQTGKVVKPDLYIGVGVSGAIQHRVGMQGASTIVAINRDLDAPIAGYADFVVMGDLFEVVPAIVDRLRGS